MFAESSQRGKIVGTMLGLLFSVGVIFFGFLKTAIVFGLAGMGFLIGKFFDDRAEISTDED